MISESQLKLWKEAAEKSTPGPWKVVVESWPQEGCALKLEQRRIFTEWDNDQLEGPEPVVTTQYSIGVDVEAAHTVYIGPANAEFIALSRIAVPELIAEIVRLQEVLLEAIIIVEEVAPGMDVLIEKARAALGDH